MSFLTPKHHGTKYLLNKINEKKIIFRHSHIAITDYHLGDHYEFEKSLSVWDKMAFTSIMVGGYYVRQLNEFRLNRGYSVDMLRRFFPNYPMVVDNDAYPDDKVKIKLFTKPRSDFQTSALTFMAAEGEFDKFKKFTQYMVTAAPGKGKSLPDDTLIPIPSGFKRMGDLKKGDYVFNRYGKPVKVLGVYPQGSVMPAYKLTFSDGRYCYCSPDHLWTICDNIKQRNKTTLPLWAFMHKIKNGNFMVPSSDAVEYDPQEVIIDPFQYGILCNDHISPKYMYNTKEVRLSVLSGLTQKCLNNNTCSTATFSTGSFTLAEDAIQLARSLGFRAYHVPDTENIDNYLVIILMYPSPLKIVDCVYSHECRQTCILVDDPEHLFMTENYIPTHNTYCGVASTAMMEAKCIVIVPLAKLLNQWKESFVNFTSVKENEVMIVQGGSKCMEILEEKHLDKKVFIFMVDTIAAFNKKYGDIKTMDMLSSTRAKIKIVDEVHLDLKAISMIEALSNFRLNYYMSASPGRTDSKEYWIFNNLFRHVPRFGGKFDTEQEKYLNIVVKKYYFTPTNKMIGRMVNRKTGMNSALYEKELMFSGQTKSFDESLVTMFQWAKKQKKKKNKIMILAKSVEFLDYIKNILKDHIKEDKLSIYHGGMKKKEKEKALEAEVIIATSQSLGTGADISGLQFVINTSTYSSWVSAIQISGRLRELPDKTPVVYIELVNYGYRKTINQFESRKPHLLKVTKNGKILMVE